MLISERKYIKYFNILSAIVLVYCFISFSIFLYLNWENIINPFLIPFYENAGSVFNYSEDLAKFTNYGLILPLEVFSSLIVFHLVSLINLWKHKSLSLSFRLFTIGCFIWIFLWIIPWLFGLYLLIFNFLLMLILFIKFRKSRMYLKSIVLMLLSAILYLYLIISYFNLFFD